MKTVSIFGALLAMSSLAMAEAEPNDLVVAPGRMNRLDARAAKDCGIFHMDCSTAPEACNNACFYQNCIKTGTVTYKDGGADDNNENRIEAGAKVSKGAAVCRSYPHSQKFWDQYKGKLSGNEKLETDEWPMAAMQQDDFKPGTIRNALRCIKSTDNGNGGNQYKQFRRGQGDWYGKDGKYKKDRKCADPGKVLSKGDFFTVKFENVDAKKSPYCKPKPDCANDGFQFHLTKLVGNGYLDSPYKYDEMNRYAVTKSNADLRHYAVVVTRSGKDGEDFKAVVYSDPEKKKQVGSKDGKVKKGETLEVGGLPEKVKVKSTGGFDAKLGFEYAADKNKSVKYFAFDSETKGRWKEKTEQPYCEKETSNKNGKKVVETSCYFPGF